MFSHTLIIIISLTFITKINCNNNYLINFIDVLFNAFENKNNFTTAAVNLTESESNSNQLCAIQLKNLINAFKRTEIWSIQGLYTVFLSQKN